MILPDGAQYKRQGSLFTVPNSIANRMKVHTVYPEWVIPRHLEVIMLQPFAAREVFK